MNITLTWTPGASASNQDVQYKLSTSSTWTTHTSVGPTIATASITGLSDNKIYDFRVITNCAGGISTSAATQQINILCPTVTTNPSNNSVGYSFAHDSTSSITAYTAKIFDTTGTTLISSQTPSGTTTRSGTFTGLTASTNYKIRIEITAGTFSKTNCSFVSVTTTADPTCNPPTGVTATLS